VLVQSWSARLLAVRRVPQDNRGKHPAGIDGAKSLTPPQRWWLATTLPLDGKATALRRLGRPKRGSTTDKRPVGLSTQTDSARQTVVRQALEPAWDATLSPHTSGFRPGRSCHEAIGALCTARRYRPQYGLTLDIATCVETIDHQALLAKAQAPPQMRRPRKAWLQAGLLEEAVLSPTTAGTPQGGSCAPL
jgi:RNA-directed DNA polymerase